MIWIYPEQLSKKLNKKNKFIYILFGNDLSLLQDSHEDIINTIKKSYDCEHFRIQLDKNYDWDQIFTLCKETNLFSKLQILSIHFSQDYPISSLKKNVSTLLSLTKDNLVFILIIYKLNQFIQQNNWIHHLYKQNILLINCITPEYSRLTMWIQNQAKRMQLVIENLACQLLCSYYEGNTIRLKQILEHLFLIYPDGNLTFDRVKTIIVDSSCFNYNHWIESILMGRKQRANRILNQLDYMRLNLKILLHKIQHEILIIIRIKYDLIAKKNVLSVLFDKYKIYTQYRRIMLSKAMHRLSLMQLHKAIFLLTQMELQYYQNYMEVSKIHFELLAEILCYKSA
ncbi:DNA polymerase III, delta subunit [Candidatus Blochmanniella vafra str. BVAF]|uniref:DNA polymerase III subunit delta n=1 Tax=Blochmanniella vafra (strain BVAF) TaxID=859654 RepID=E8Q6W4_BLOVB|nr:DNA polymerase III subunit delta [Candidatus Blochmannia vafer]ADV33711.1 DNA polymerase III, delta subunit [Candidatus Blochmannia vafer str. BVAF]